MGQPQGSKKVSLVHLSSESKEVKIACIGQAKRDIRPTSSTQEERQAALQRLLDSLNPREVIPEEEEDLKSRLLKILDRKKPLWRKKTYQSNRTRLLIFAHYSFYVFGLVLESSFQTQHQIYRSGEIRHFCGKDKGVEMGGWVGMVK